MKLSEALKSYGDSLINNFLLLHRNKEGGIIPPSETKIFDARKNDPPSFFKGGFSLPEKQILEFVIFLPI